MVIFPGPDCLSDGVEHLELKALLKARERAYIVAVAALTRWQQVEEALQKVLAQGGAWL